MVTPEHPGYKEVIEPATSRGKLTTRGPAPRGGGGGGEKKEEERRRKREKERERYDLKQN